MRLTALGLALVVGVAGWPADAAERSSAQRAAFQRANPCPLNGKIRGRCPGYEIDHIRPLCAGGADRPLNMQWLTVPAHRVKTRGDVRACRRK